MRAKTRYASEQRAWSEGRGERRHQQQRPIRVFQGFQRSQSGGILSISDDDEYKMRSTSMNCKFVDEKRPRKIMSVRPFVSSSNLTLLDAVVSNFNVTHLK